MALHRLTHVTMGVPNPDEALAFYSEFGLGATTPGRLATVDGGEQLRVVPAPTRRVIELGVGADDPDDLARVNRQLSVLGVEVSANAEHVEAVDQGTGVRVRVAISPRIQQASVPEPQYNAPGRRPRLNRRADGVVRDTAVRPRKLGHVVMGSTAHEQSQRFFVDGLGFKVSDTVIGRASFLRCSEDHHNVLIQNTPVKFLHHTSWQVEDVDEVGRGASAMLEQDPARHVWGLGRHHIGSNFFWYLRDPAGNFAEYYSDLDCIVDDALWSPETFEGRLGLWNWGPPPPPSFLKPDDLANLMTDNH